MMWIAMYEGFFNHPKMRRLKKEIGCSGHEVAGIMYNLWSWALHNTDPSGMILYADRHDIEDLLRGQLDIRYDPVVVVEALINTGWLDETDNVLYIHDWPQWQEPWIKIKTAKERDAQRKRAEREKKKTSQEPSKAPKSEELEIPDTNIQKPPKPPAKESYSDGFTKFWDVYPRKVDKGAAYKKYKARLNDGWSEEELLQAAVAYLKEVKAEKRDMKYIKHGATFLGDSTPFVDYIQKKPKSEYTGDPFGDWRQK